MLSVFLDRQCDIAFSQPPNESDDLVRVFHQPAFGGSPAVSLIGFKRMFPRDRLERPAREWLSVKRPYCGDNCIGTHRMCDIGVHRPGHNKGSTRRLGGFRSLDADNQIGVLDLLGGL
jgi:hypothetical protein